MIRREHSNVKARVRHRRPRSSLASLDHISAGLPQINLGDIL
jgi:hypothetical protein